MAIVLDPDALGGALLHAQEQLDLIIEEEKRLLREVGAKAQAHARSIPAPIGYEDQTGNLRSSTGYGIVVDGILEAPQFERVQGKRTDPKGADGAEVGRQYLEELAQGEGVGLTLFVVAGMHYARYVQQVHGRDVLDSAEVLVAREMELGTQDLVQALTDE